MHELGFFNKLRQNSIKICGSIISVKYCQFDLMYNISMTLNKISLVLTFSFDMFVFL